MKSNSVNNPQTLYPMLMLMTCLSLWGCGAQPIPAASTSAADSSNSNDAGPCSSEVIEDVNIWTNHYNTAKDLLKKTASSQLLKQYKSALSDLHADNIRIANQYRHTVCNAQLESTHEQVTVDIDSMLGYAQTVETKLQGIINDVEHS